MSRKLLCRRYRFDGYFADVDSIGAGEMKNILALARERYRSLSEPNFSFVREALERRPFSNLEIELGRIIDVEDAPDDDVSSEDLTSEEHQK
jgi:hypothetical protein